MPYRGVAAGSLLQGEANGQLKTQPNDCVQRGRLRRSRFGGPGGQAAGGGPRALAGDQSQLQSRYDWREPIDGRTGALDGGRESGSLLDEREGMRSQETQAAVF